MYKYLLYIHIHIYIHVFIFALTYAFVLLPSPTLKLGFARHDLCHLRSDSVHSIDSMRLRGHGGARSNLERNDMNEFIKSFGVSTWGCVKYFFEVTNLRSKFNVSILWFLENSTGVRNLLAVWDREKERLTSSRSRWTPNKNPQIRFQHIFRGSWLPGDAPTSHISWKDNVTSTLIQSYSVSHFKLAERQTNDVY